jgi:deoxyinosine 3'endonuclease (endonuclease V)
MSHCYLFGFVVIAEFLDFQEAPALVETFSRLCDTKLNLVPECVLVDGNGILHPRDFGLASHVGELKCCIAIAECRSPCLCVALTTVLQT